MFKKKLAILVAAAMLSLSASSAFAAFADLQLIRVIYERTTGTVETATDLGNINSLLAGPTQTIANSAVALSASNPANLFVAYFAIDHATTGTGVGDLWVSSTGVAPIAVGAAGFAPAKNGTTPMFSYYNSLGTGTVVAQQSNINSYRTKLTASQGAIGNAVNTVTRPFVEASLASLIDGSATSVTQGLYFFTNANTASSVAVKVADIITNADGSTTVVTATPIPAAIYLMGSGLLGLVGLRRRNRA